jgi:diacylglycerol kinase (ATP)
MGRPKRVAVVFNPATGGGDTAGRKRDTQEALQGAGLEVLWLETTLEDPGQGLTAKALAEGVDLVMARGATAR